MMVSVLLVDKQGPRETVRLHKSFEVGLSSQHQSAQAAGARSMKAAEEGSAPCPAPGGREPRHILLCSDNTL